ncbi:hypothetical protein TH606_02940 [Thermodesulfatator autotrophicus]|uniref:Uncharacterized protein n=1 Tax=Thermodesulfatator autotrophicus TaxID=1795632 RepID=A0A177E8D9_9BACT|nr:hypothetical protein TH606_02940 [Thermodesulfatator autotrophicus]
MSKFSSPFILYGALSPFGAFNPGYFLYGGAVLYGGLLVRRFGFEILSGRRKYMPGQAILLKKNSQDIASG